MLSVATKRCLFLGACISTALAVTATGSAAVNAIIVGKVVSCFGPSCGPQRNAVVSAVDARGRVVATESITNGYFTFALEPGNYVLSAKTRQGRSARRRSTAQAGQTTKTKITFYIADRHRQPRRHSPDALGPLLNGRLCWLDRISTMSRDATATRPASPNATDPTVSA